MCTTQPNASKNARESANWGLEPLRHLGPLGVVAVEQLDAVVGGIGAEAEHDGPRVVLLDLPQHEVRGAEQGVDRRVAPALDRLRQGVEGAEEHGRRVD